MPFLVFSTAFLTLAVEVFYTRLFSALFWKNTAFAILSLAMLGIGASGVWVFLFPSFFSADRAKRQLAWLMTAFGLSIVGSYLWVLALSHAAHNVMDPLGAYVPLILAGLGPFFAGGLVLSVAFSHSPKDIPRLYRLDLVGASLGAILVLPLLRLLNGPMLVPLLALLATGTGLWFAWKIGAKGAAVGGAVSSAAILALGAWHITSGVLRVTHSHGQLEENIDEERWDPLARITVQAFGPQSKWLNIDSQVVTAVLRYGGDPAEVDYLKHNVLQLAYRLRHYPKVLIVGPGGGSDVLSAVTSGNPDITAVEVNRSTIGLMQHELREYTGGLYDLPGVKLRIADGRAYVAAMKEHMDLIQATFVDTFTSSASGAHTLSENYLYTVNGFQDFLGHLNQDGVLSMSRWGGEVFSFAETHRAVAIVRSALDARHVARPGDHVVVVQGALAEELTVGGGYQHPGNRAESMSTLLVKNSPFTASELDRLTTTITESKFRPLWLGSRGGSDTTIRALFAPGDRTAVYREYKEETGLDIVPVTDDRPFYFDMIDPIASLFTKPKAQWTRHAYYFARTLDIDMLHELLKTTAALALGLLILPLLGRIRDVRAVPRPVSTLSYFVCLGVGFIGIELTMMQRFSLFLEHPVYSLVVFLSSILLFSGLGSASTEKFGASWQREAPRRAGALVVILGLYGVLVPPLTRALIGLPLVVKMLIAVACAFPPAFLMGMLFPLGIAAIREQNPRLVPWVWGLNSAFSVVGAIASLFLAMSFGYTTTWFVFVGAYALAAITMMRLARA
jgi:8-oxo-dGTP pyrophosphatase MutT (NUDIX family)